MPQKASELKAKGVSYRKFSEKIGNRTHDLRKSLKELLQSETPEVGRIRKKGGGRKHSLTSHPDWKRALIEIIELRRIYCRSTKSN